MTNNDVLRSIRFMLDVADHTLVSITQLGGREVPLSEMVGYVSREGEHGYLECPDVVMGHFLDGLISHRRGRDESAPVRPVESTITNNAVLKKLRVAFKLNEADILSMMAASGHPVSKPELSALFRSPGHKNFRLCGDQFLRAFLKALTQRERGVLPSDDDAPE